MLRTGLFFFLVLLVSAANNVYYAPCTESATRPCVYGTNTTDRLLALKKGGSDVLSTNNYDSTFFPCEQYNYNCGYQEYSTSFLTVANGVQLNATYTELLNWVPSDATLTNLMKPYLSLQGSKARCVSNVLPLILTDTQSNTVLIGYLNRIASNLSTIYTTNKFSGSLTWSNVNINIKTAVLQMAKYNMNTNFVSSSFWTAYLLNNFTPMSTELKTSYTQLNCRECLHSAYLIDSVTSTCNKYQSINFLVDESSSIGSSSFSSALSFLSSYVSQTNDDLTMMSINFFDSSFESWMGYNNNKTAVLSRIAAKTYRGSGNPATGSAINASVAQINAANFPNGTPKILVVLTSGTSTNDVVQATNYANSFGIIILCIGVGGGVSNTQLLQMAGTQSNIINVASYSSLSQLATLLPNYLCKQMLIINVGSTLYGNYVKVPSCPSYFSVPRSSNASQYYQLTITYLSDPQLSSVAVLQSHYDPFPDVYSNYTKSDGYRTSILTQIYFISPISNDEIPVKKTLTVTSSPSYSYFSIAGTNINFTIGLTLCNTIDCAQEISVASSIGKSNYGNILNDDPQASNVDPSIFVPIGLALGALALFTVGSIYGLKKMVEPSEGEITNELSPENEDLGNEEISRNEYISRGQQEVASQQNINSRRSGKGRSQHSNKHRSEGSNKGPQRSPKHEAPRSAKHKSPKSAKHESERSANHQSERSDKHESERSDKHSDRSNKHGSQKSNKYGPQQQEKRLPKKSDNLPQQKPKKDSPNKSNQHSPEKSNQHALEKGKKSGHKGQK